MNTEYITDITYHRSFVEDLSPSRMRLVAALNGFPTPPAADFDYCELGSSHGDTVCVLASANPHARFIGVDLNPAHIEVAHRLAREGNLGNARFLEGDFSDLWRPESGANIPPLDFICAHGVLSWIGPGTRKAFLDFANAKLKPGGLLYVGYNALPGWASVEPLRHLLLTGAAGAKGDTVEAARLGFGLAKHLFDAGALYFKGNPSAAAMLKKMEEAGLPYIAHEYLNANWTPMYFSDLVREMAASDLYFAGQLPFYANYRDLVLPPAMAKMFEDVTDRVTFETFKDYALNEFFRRDVFIKGKAGRSAAATDAYLDATSFALGQTRPAADFRLPHGILTFEGPLFDALFGALGEGSATGEELLSHRELTAFAPSDVRAALLRAVLTERAVPVQRAVRTLHQAEDRLLRVPLEYNRMVLRQTLRKEIPFVLASQVTGNGVPISALEALAIRLLTEVPTSKWREWIHDLFTRHAYRLNIGDRPVEGVDEGTRVVLGEIEKFQRERLGRFLEWGILE